MNDMRKHVTAAEQWLEKAAEVEGGPRCHLAKVYAAMAQAHVGLATLAFTVARDTPRAVVADVHVGGDVDSKELSKRIWQLPPGTPLGRASGCSCPIWEQSWPDNVVMATKVYHHGIASDLSREEPSYFGVCGETKHHYIGNWVEGLGFINAWADKSGTRPLTPAERDKLATQEVTIL